MFTADDLIARKNEVGLNWKELAKRIGVDSDNLYKWKNGTRITDPEDYKKVENFVLGKDKKIENIPSAFDEPQTQYVNPNIAELLKIISSQQEMLARQHETIHLLVEKNGRAAVSA